jgi:DNA anti-recombination protein RmuC
MNFDTNQLLRRSENYAEAMRLIHEIKSLESQIEAVKKALKNTGDAGELALLDSDDIDSLGFFGI